jgi:hypothetical protein
MREEGVEMWREERGKRREETGERSADGEERTWLT